MVTFSLLIALLLNFEASRSLATIDRQLINLFLLLTDFLICDHQFTVQFLYLRVKHLICTSTLWIRMHHSMRLLLTSHDGRLNHLLRRLYMMLISSGVIVLLLNGHKVRIWGRNESVLAVSIQIRK